MHSLLIRMYQMHCCTCCCCYYCKLLCLVRQCVRRSNHSQANQLYENRYLQCTMYILTTDRHSAVQTRKLHVLFSTVWASTPQREASARESPFNRKCLKGIVHYVLTCSDQISKGSSVSVPHYNPPQANQMSSN